MGRTLNIERLSDDTYVVDDIQGVSNVLSSNPCADLDAVDTWLNANCASEDMIETRWGTTIQGHESDQDAIQATIISITDSNES